MKEFDSRSINYAISSKETIIVLFYADWCPFCRAFKPVFESFEGKARVALGEAKVNEEENPMWDMFGIDVIPSLRAFRNGKMVSKADAKPGMGLSKADFEAFLKKI